MLPDEHAAVGYLLATVPAVVRKYDPPRGLEAGALLVGTQFPDLVDKPLAYLGIISSGRSVAHSLLVALPAIAALSRYRPTQLSGRLTRFFAVGYLAHLGADSHAAVSRGEWQDHRYLLWPVFPGIESAEDAIPPWRRLADAYSPPRVRPGTALVVVALAVWLWQHRPAHDR